MTDSLVVGAILLSLLFAFTNGMKDGANVFATAVSSRSLTFRQALWLVTLAELCGPFLFGIPVALTVAKGIIRVDLLPRDINSFLLVLSGVAGALFWNGFCWFVRLPTSSSFAMVGGLVGPVLFCYGLSGIPWAIFLIKVVGALVLSPFLGLFIGGLVHRFLVRILKNAPWKTVRYLKKLQMGSLIVLGMNHGTNDSQKTMGLIALILFLSYKIQQMDVPVDMQFKRCAGKHDSNHQLFGHRCRQCSSATGSTLAGDSFNPVCLDSNDPTGRCAIGAAVFDTSANY